jgi:hypothetical protein
VQGSSGSRRCRVFFPVQGDPEMTESLPAVLEWDGEDVHTLKSLLETARADPDVSESDFGTVKTEIFSRYSKGPVENYIRGGQGYVSLVAVDTSGRGLIATIWGDGPKDEDYDIYDPILPLSIQDHVDRISALLQVRVVHGKYDTLAEALRLIAEVVGEIPINSLDELEQVLSLLRETHDLIFERIVYDLENLEVDE